VAADKVIPLAAAAEFRRTMGDFAEAGWHVEGTKFSVDVAGGAALFLCDISSGRLVMLTLRRGSLEDLARQGQERGVTFQDACNLCGTLFTDLIEGRRQLSGESKNDLAVAAGLYIVGTQGYALGMPRMTLPQFLVLRVKDHEKGGHLLRPVPLIKTSPMTPEELVDVANRTLIEDFKNHPARFGRGQVLPFRLKT
jgi:hypothetical protein